MSIFILSAARFYERPSALPDVLQNSACLLYNLKDCPLAVARGGTGEQRANSMNGLAAAANNPADVSSPKLKLKDGCSAAWNFRQDHVVRKFDQLTDDEFEKFSHAPGD
jgi:hypothetical protein